MRLIDAYALIAEMHNVILEDGEDRRTFYAVIERQPTIEERKTGKWICSDDMYETAVCSSCGWDTTDPWGHIVHWFKYCPNCGARME